MKLRVLSASVLAFSLAVATVAVAQPPGRGAMMQACGADFQKFCPDAKPGPQGGMRECMQAHQNDFSDVCKKALADMRAARLQQQQNGGGATNSTAH